MASFTISVSISTSHYSGVVTIKGSGVPMPILLLVFVLILSVKLVISQLINYFLSACTVFDYHNRPHFLVQETLCWYATSKAMMLKFWIGINSLLIR